MAEFEALDLRLHAGRLDAPGHLAQHVGGREKRPVAEIERTAIEGADLRPEFLDMRNALRGAGHVRARPARSGVRGIEDKVAAHAGGQVDDDVGVRRADRADRLAIERGIARGLAGRGIAHMQMHDRGARSVRLQGRVGDLPRGHRNGRMLADRVAGPGHGAGNDDFRIQDSRSVL